MRWNQIIIGFIIGMILALALMLASIYFVGSAEARSLPDQHARSAMPHERRSIDMTQIRRVPFYRTWLRVGMCEQPKPGISWLDVRTDRQRVAAINWRHDGPGVTFPGGLGMTQTLWEQFRRSSQRRVARMSRASIVEQLWSAYRFWRWAERTYPGYGYTGWDCSRIIGWTTSNPNDALR